MSKLFEEVTIGGVNLRNRYAMAPMGSIHGMNGEISPEQRAYYVERAKGGFSLIYPGAHHVSDRFERIYCNLLTTEYHAQCMADAVKELHRFGAKFALELTPGFGRVNAGMPGVDCEHVSASDSTVFFHPGYKCRALTVDEIHYLVECTGRSAALAKRAGVDVLELHAYGGYLFDQFLSELWNHREDEYGGSLENRMRFLIECYQAIRDAVGPNYPVSIKFTPEHGIPEGRTLEGEGLEIARILDNMGFAYIHLDDGCYECWNRAIPTAYDAAGCQAHVARYLRAAGIKTPFLIQGKLNDPEMAEKLVEEGVADIIALGKQSIADPYYPNKVKAGHLEDIRYCISCGECLNHRADTHNCGCAINPRAEHELEYIMPKAETKRKILVIGGGPGGMNAAKFAAEQGHTVELWEKRAKLGGNINAAGGPDFKFDMKRYNETLQKQLYKAGVTVCLGKEATKEQIDMYAPDAVIIATGSVPVVPPIKGLTETNSVNVVDVLSDRIDIGKSKEVVVLGAGEVGCEAALYLERRGNNVTVVEMQDDILTGDMAKTNRMGLISLLENSGVKFRTKTKVVEVTDGQVILSADGGISEIACDTVVLAAGLRSSKSLAESLKGASYRTFTIGDCNQPRKVFYAVHEGFHIIRQLDELMKTWE